MIQNQAGKRRPEDYTKENTIVNGEKNKVILTDGDAGHSGYDGWSGQWQR